MKLETLLEQTVGLRCHTYLVTAGGKAVAYRRDSGEIDVFSKPLSFSKRYRKFKKVVDKELERSYTVYNS
jgi:hypothetical protein